MSIMKFAVCSRSSTASRRPPNVIRGTLAVATLPTEFKRRSRILFVSLTVDDRGVDFVEDDAGKLLLGSTECCDDVFHAVVDVEIDRQDCDEAVGDVEQLAVGQAPRHRRSVEYNQIVAAGGARMRDRLANSVGGLFVGAFERRQDRNSVCGRDGA